MRQIVQARDEIAASLTEMDATWLDAKAGRVIELIAGITPRPTFTVADIAALLDQDFDAALIAFQLFLDFSKDKFVPRLAAELGPGGAGVKRFRQDRVAYLAALQRLGLPEAMAELVNRPVIWSDLLTERLKWGRGSAIQGQARGRSLEDFVEEIVRRVFGERAYEPRCTFVGKSQEHQAKADFAIPSRVNPRIVIEAKGYAATGSKQTDVLGDLIKIVDAKRNDTTLLFVTDGLTWRQRTSDLDRIVAMQNRGEVARVYTRAMQQQMEEDLRTLKVEHGL